MTNPVHLLCMPRKEKGISQMMQDLGGCYVRYFNYEYKRTGILWEGRYKSCLIQSDRYLLEVYRYIERSTLSEPGLVQILRIIAGRAIGSMHWERKPII
ncbi:MAG: transposase [Thermodesulfobacteriota bacterium]